MPAGSVLPGLDVTAIAHVYAALSRSPWADAADRAAAEEINARFPGAYSRMRHAREFHARAACQAVTRTARGVVFGASPFPADAVPHEAAAQANPDARFCYAAADDDITRIRAALAGPSGAVTACTASVRDPAGLLARPEVAALPRPLHLQVQLSLHWWPPHLARCVIREYGKRLDRGDVMLLTWGLPADTAAGRELAALTGKLTGAQVHRHPAKAVASWLERAGFEVLPPGPGSVRGWGLGWGEHALSRGPGRVMGVLARAG